MKIIRAVKIAPWLDEPRLCIQCEKIIKELSIQNNWKDRKNKMKKEELQQSLMSANVPKFLYNLDGGLPNEAFCLNKDGEIWEVYYSERGIKSQLKQFDSEHEACIYFYKTVLDFLDM